MKAGDTRYIPPGSCSWCGHKPHPDVCPGTIRTAHTEAEPCPCSKIIR